jgi:hypothetical protein
METHKESLSDDYFLVRGTARHDGTFFIPLVFTNPANDCSIIIECMVDTGASHIVLADEKISELKLMFGNEDMGTTVIADGKKAVGPIHNLIVGINDVKLPRPKPTLIVLFSRGAHSLIGMSFLVGIGAIISCSDANIYIPKKWKGNTQNLREGITSDLANQNREKGKYKDENNLRNIDNQRLYIDDIVKQKNTEVGKDIFITMLCIEENNQVMGKMLGSIGPVPISIHDKLDEDQTISIISNEDIKYIENVIKENGLLSDDIIGKDMGITSYY